jgi:ribosome biogenesis GTPase
VRPENILKSFEDLYAVIETCPRDCSHLNDAPDCALDAHIAEAAATDSPDEKFARRVDSLRRLMASLSTAGKTDD